MRRELDITTQPIDEAALVQRSLQFQVHAPLQAADIDRKNLIAHVLRRPRFRNAKRACSSI